jgi:hypothetical protein
MSPGNSAAAIAGTMSTVLCMDAIAGLVTPWLPCHNLHA